MNSKDFELPEDGSVEDLSAQEIALLIWDKQHSLIQKYQPIEGIPPYPFKLDSSLHQEWIKDWFWRITEEISEFEESIEKEEYDHAVEELSDVLHFFTGLFILLGHSEKYPKLFKWALEVEVEDKNISPFRVTYHLGLAGNCLKNKKWKQSPVRTNVEKFEGHLESAWKSFFVLLKRMHLTEASDIYEIYFGKNQTNHERIKSNY